MGSQSKEKAAGVAAGIVIDAEYSESWVIAARGCKGWEGTLSAKASAESGCGDDGIVPVLIAVSVVATATSIERKDRIMESVCVNVGHTGSECTCAVDTIALEGSCAQVPIAAVYLLRIGYRCHDAPRWNEILGERVAPLERLRSWDLAGARW